MRLQDAPRLPSELAALVRQLDTLYRNTAQQVNQLSEGQAVATYNASPAAPTAGSYSVGDFVKNSAPTELGAASSKYLVTGWICSAAPLTFLQCRVLTGN